MWFHRHEWENINVNHYWVYDHFQCSHGDEERGYPRYAWPEQEIYQEQNPGARKLNCPTGDTHLHYPEPYSIIQQKCICGKYRTQRVAGIIKFQPPVVPESPSEEK